MKNIKSILLYGMTIVVIVFAVIWEYYIQQWEAAQPANHEEILRVDLFVLYPLIITLIALSLFRLFRNKK